MQQKYYELNSHTHTQNIIIMNSDETETKLLDISCALRKTKEGEWGKEMDNNVNYFRINIIEYYYLIFYLNSLI